MGYYNRLAQFKTTLDSIERSKVKDEVEVVVVDDGSNKNQHGITEEMLHEYSFTIHVWRVTPEEKKWINPVVAYNMALSQAVGEWIIIQNPEVCHVGDICDYVLRRRMEIDKYLAFSVFACVNLDMNAVVSEMLKRDDPYHELTDTGNILQGFWYCHSEHRNKAFHFCTAIHRSRLNLVGGFNLDMRNGIDFDDDEFLCRVGRVCKVEIVDLQNQVMGVHQWHESFAYQGDVQTVSTRRSHNYEVHKRTLYNRNKIWVDPRVGEGEFVIPDMEEGKGWDSIVEYVTNLPRVEAVGEERAVVVTITGIRPDFIRMSKVFKELDKHFHHIMIHTGQHYDSLLSDVFFDELEIRAPDYNLDTGTKATSHYEQLGLLSTAVIECLRTNNIKPAIILFLGDSNSVACALPLKKEGYRIGHIEAGMRSGDRRMLEEINRTVCDVCSDVFFVYHDDYKANLLAENISRPIFVVGNTVVEPCRQMAESLKLFEQPKRLDVVLMDIHRPENFGNDFRLEQVFKFANLLGTQLGLPVKCLHFKRLNDSITRCGINLGKVEIVPLMSYKNYLTQVYHAKVLLSDSGTAQEEPGLVMTPVVVPRDFTERPQSFQSNCSTQLFLENGDMELQLNSILAWIQNHEKFGERFVDTSWLGDGSTSKQIAEQLSVVLSNPSTFKEILPQVQVNSGSRSRLKEWHLTQIPKVCHFYWEGSLPFLRYVALMSFTKMNPKWNVKIHTSSGGNMDSKWRTPEKPGSDGGNRLDYFDKLGGLPATEVIYHNFEEEELGIPNSAHPSHKSDCLRWYILSTEGGLWCDSDILHLRPIESLTENRFENRDVISVLCRYRLYLNIHAIGFMMSSPGNCFFQTISGLVKSAYNPSVYQSIGSNLLGKMDAGTIYRFGGGCPLYIDEHALYKVSSNLCSRLADGTYSVEYFDDVLGVHYYGGDPEVNKVENELTEENYPNHPSVLAKLVSQMLLK